MRPGIPVQPSTTIAAKPNGDWLGPLHELVAQKQHLAAKSAGRFDVGGTQYEMEYCVFSAPGCGDSALRVGIFAGIYGDEPEGMHAIIQLAQILDKQPELAEGYQLNLFPMCNPTGLEDRTLHSRNGKDLNREFWKNSNELEVRLLEAHLLAQTYDGIISLHTDKNSSGFYSLARRATITRHLLKPAMAATAKLLPINHDNTIDGFHAKDGIVEGAYDGALSASPQARPKPFEIVLRTPGRVPAFLRAAAHVIALRAILAEYRKFIAYAPNL